jgi:hypothetical protein
MLKAIINNTRLIDQWQPLVYKKGKAIDGQATFRMRHFMGNEGKVFDLIVQRSVVTGQVEDCRYLAKHCLL